MNIGFSQSFERFRPETLKYSEGYPWISSRFNKHSSEIAKDLLDAQNSSLSNERMVELTYGPKKEKVQSFVPDYVKLDNKILCFQGVVRERIEDWPGEQNRVHLVKLLYYLENDTMKVIEPEVPNSGLCQGTMFNRSRYLHPNNKGNYQWKDLNVGNDVHLFGRTIHLYNCDLWTRAFLTEQGIEVNGPEPTPENPILIERQAMEARNEVKYVPDHAIHPASQFFAYDGKVLRFYGILKNELEFPMEIRRVVLNYYLSDGTLEVLENWKPDGGRGPMMPHGREIFDNIPTNVGKGSGMTIIKKQRILLDRKKEVEKLPCYLEPGEEDDVDWLSPANLKTGEDLTILGKTFFLNKCNDFTKQFYKDNYGIELPQMEVMQKPKLKTPTIVSPHEYGQWDEGLQDCFKPHATLRAKVNKMCKKPKDVADAVLRFSAFLDTTRETEQDRVFVISYFMEDDAIKIHENRVKNSGHPGGTFMGRCRLRKDLGKTAELTPSLARGAKPKYYEPSDFYIGAKIRASGCTFVIKDADLATFRFMENHPEIYPDVNPEEQRKLANFLKGYVKPSHNERMRLLGELKQEVFKNSGSTVFPYPKTLNLRSGYTDRSQVEEQLFSANLPISPTSLKKLLDVFTFNEKTDLGEIKTFLKVSLGHNRDH